MQQQAVQRLGPYYTPYHMMAESRPLTSIPPVSPSQDASSTTATVPYHAYPLPTDTSIVVYICMPIANYAAASCLNDRGLPTHHTISSRRVGLYTTCVA